MWPVISVMTLVAIVCAWGRHSVLVTHALFTKPIATQAFNLFSLAHKTGAIPKARATAAVSWLRSKAELMEQSLQPGVNLKLYRDVASKMAQVSGLI